MSDERERAETVSCLRNGGSVCGGSRNKYRIKDMEELQKTEFSFKKELAILEKKAHDSWFKAHAAERALAEEKREASNLRHKLLEVTQKMAMMWDEPVIVRSLPGRPTHRSLPGMGY